MSESNTVFKYFLSQHPLYQAVEKCIDRGVTDTYNYHDFFPSWNGRVVDHKTIIQELFRVDQSRLELFIERRKPGSEYLDLYTYTKHGDQEFSKKLFRFLLALPMCEYEIANHSNALSKSTGSVNQFSMSLSPFKYDDKYISRIDDEEVSSTIRNILILSPDEKLINGISRFAFVDYELINRDEDLENVYKLEFKDHLVQPVCSFLLKTLHLGIKLKPDIKSVKAPNGVTLKVLSDLHLIKNGQVFCTIEVKMFPILPAYVGQSTSMIGTDIFNQLNINKFMKQLISQMVYFKTNMGIVTDSYIVIFVEIDLDIFERNINELKGKVDFHEHKTVPLRYKVLDCHSAAPTLREALMHFFYTAYVDDETEKIRQERMLKLREYLWATPEQDEEQTEILEYNTERSDSSSGSRPSTAGTAGTQSSTTLVSHDEEDEELEEEDLLEFTANDHITMQNGDIYNSQLIAIDAHYMKKYLLRHVEDTEKLVAKFYDPRMANNEHGKFKYSKKELLKLCLNAYNNERWMYRVLSRDPGFNSCYVPHKRGYMKVRLDRYYLTKGYFNLFHYIETIPLDNKDIELYGKAKVQLDVIHRHGIIHGDIKAENILCAKDGKVYIIDFAFSVTKNEWNTHKSIESDISELKYVFGLDGM